MQRFAQISLTVSLGLLLIGLEWVHSFKYPVYANLAPSQERLVIFEAFMRST